MEPIQRSPADLLHPVPVALGSPPLGGGLPSPPSLSKPAVVRADLVLLEKLITSHFNNLLGMSNLTKPAEETSLRLANIGICCGFQVCRSWVAPLVAGGIYQESSQIYNDTSTVCRQSVFLSSTRMIVSPTTFGPGMRSSALLCNTL